METMEPIEVMDESDYENALAYIDKMWGIEKYLDIRTKREFNEMIDAVRAYEDLNYPM
jgi:hypothetical protein